MSGEVRMGEMIMRAGDYHLARPGSWHAEIVTPTRALLFFHGTPGARLMARFADPIARRHGIRIVAPERPGYGLSDVQPGRSIAQWPDDVAALADSLGLERFALAGVSGGAPYVAAYAHRMPRRRLDSMKLKTRRTLTYFQDGLPMVARVRAP